MSASCLGLGEECDERSLVRRLVGIARTRSIVCGRALGVWSAA